MNNFNVNGQCPNVINLNKDPPFSHTFTSKKNKTLLKYLKVDLLFIDTVLIN